MREITSSHTQKAADQRGCPEQLSHTTVDSQPSTRNSLSASGASPWNHACVRMFEQGGGANPRSSQAECVRVCVAQGYKRQAATEARPPLCFEDAPAAMPRHLAGSGTGRNNRIGGAGLRLVVLDRGEVHRVGAAVVSRRLPQLRVVRTERTRRDEHAAHVPM